MANEPIDGREVLQETKFKMPNLEWYILESDNMLSYFFFRLELSWNLLFSSSYVLEMLNIKRNKWRVRITHDPCKRIRSKNPSWARNIIHASRYGVNQNHWANNALHMEAYITRHDLLVIRNFEHKPNQK